MNSRSSLPFTFLVPTVILLLILALTPTIYALNVSFTDRNLFSDTSNYIGWDNYVRHCGNLSYSHGLLFCSALFLYWKSRLPGANAEILKTLLPPDGHATNWEPWPRVCEVIGT